MIPLWLAGVIILGAVVGVFALVFMICYGFVGFLMLKDKLERRKK